MKDHDINLLPIGTKLGHYLLDRCLGQGSFGITYLAQDSLLERQVAIKEFFPQEVVMRDGTMLVCAKSELHRTLFEEGKRSYLEEAQTLARFKHHNIVRVLTFFEANGTGYAVMEYEAGKSLADLLIRMHTLEEYLLLAISLPLLSGLSKLHAAGIIHRDIKPDNIYIREDGSPVLLDFGAARQFMGRKTTTVTSILTPGYAPYEQYQTERSQQGTYTDIYALGAVLYHGVSGRRPPDAIRRADALLKGKQDPMCPAIGEGHGRYSEHFLVAIDTALQLLGSNRPQTCEEFAVQLHGEGVPTPIWPASKEGIAWLAEEETAGSTKTGEKTDLAATLVTVVGMDGGVGAPPLPHSPLPPNLMLSPVSDTTALVPMASFNSASGFPVWAKVVGVLMTLAVLYKGQGHWFAVEQARKPEPSGIGTETVGAVPSLTAIRDDLNKSACGTTVVEGNKPTDTPSPGLTGSAANPTCSAASLPGSATAPSHSNSVPPPEVDQEMLVEQRRKAEAEQLVKEGQSLLAQANEQKDRRQRADQLIVARDKFSAAVQIDDHNVSAHTNLGVIFLINSDYIFAQEHLERAAKLDPGSPLAYYNLAAAYSRDEQKGLSLDALDKAIGNGFQDCKQIMRDPDLQFIRTAAKPAFQAILKDRDSPCALQLGTIRQ